MSSNVSLPGEGLSLVSLSAGVTQLAIDAAPFLNSGTISSSGTITASTLAARNLIGNASSVGAIPTGIAIAPNLSLSAAGTLDIAHSPSIVAVSQTAPMIINGNTGAGTVASFPQGTLLYMEGQDGQPSVQLLESWGTPGSRYRARRSSGTKAAPVALTAGEGIFELSAQGWDGSVFSSVCAEIFAYTIENWTTTAHGSALTFNAVPVGATTITTGAVVIGDGTSGIVMLGTLAQTGTNPAWAGGPRLQVVDQNGILANVVNIGTSSAALNITQGAGVPTGTVAAGSMYLRNDGSLGARIYVSAGGGAWNPVALV